MDIHKFWGIPVFLFIFILGNIPAWAEEDKMLTLCESMASKGHIARIIEPVNAMFVGLEG